MTRPSFTETMFKIVLDLAERGTCPRLAAASVAVNDRYHILACGYNGAPRGMPHCIDVGCMMVDGHCVRTLHSEWNMICQAAYEGISLRGAKVFITARPCQICVKMMIQAGITQVQYYKAYNTDGIADQVETLARHANMALTGPYEGMK